MSVTRFRLLAALAAAALTPAAPCLAQAYGARAVVEHNDLRWFEPTELDLDGQMPRDKAGFFFSVDKLQWWVVNPRTEVGHEGLTVDSERIYRAPSNDLALTALDQLEALTFIDDLDENLAYSGITFVIADTQGTQTLTDDTVRAYDASNFALVADLRTGLDAFSAAGVGNAVDGTNDKNSLTEVVRVGGEPTPYQVRNGIRNALQDPGVNWGERYEFGYSDGERGWMVSILDGPEARSGGVYGELDTPYTSQTDNVATPGPDPNFASSLDEVGPDGRLLGDGDVGASDLFALGFGSVAVNFNLPTPDFLSGYRDYFNNSIGAAGGTTSGPVLYVGNYGTLIDDANPFDIGDNAGFNRVEVDDAITAIQTYSAQASDPPTMDPNESILDTQIALILNEINRVGTIINDLDDDDGQAALDALAGAALTAVNNLQVAQANQQAMNAGMVPPNTLTTEINATTIALVNLNTALAGIVLEVDADGGDGDTTDGQAQRLADDLDGNGQAGVTTVLADIDGDGVIDPDEVIAVINNFGDLHDFNVFFDQVTIRNTTELDGVELMRTHQLSTRHKLEQGRWDNLRLSYGVRFLSLDDEFFFQGLGSVLGRTTVETNIENQIVGPQLGLQWIRRDGPWDFVVEGRGTLGYNIVDADQVGLFGEEAIPGALNRSATARATTSVDGESYNEFSPLAELRAQLRYRVASAVTLQAGYTAKYIGNVHRAGLSTAWNAPDFGIDDSTSDIFVNGFNIGVELRH